jgi:hypothetical protein
LAELISLVLIGLDAALQVFKGLVLGGDPAEVVIGPLGEVAILTL